jgi:hypothetical protein
MIRQKIRFFITSCLLVIFFFGPENGAFAQGNIRINHVVTPSKIQSDRYLGRDMWFCIPENEFVNQDGRFYDIYVNSPKNGSVHFQIQGSAEITKPLTANKVTIFSTPTDFTFSSGEIGQRSGVVLHDRAIHVWSDNADIAVYCLIRKAFSTDGMYILPTTGWGKTYNVGAYISLPVSSMAEDDPSEFAIVSNQDNTQVNIIPNYDIRQDGQTATNAVLHAAHVPFTEVLMKGDCIQYQIVGNPSSDDFDASGTFIQSNNPVGVIGASECPFINSSEPYCDFVCEMMQPMRAWSNVYYTAPFAGRTYGGDGFLLLPTKNNQLVYRNDPTQTNPAATLTLNSPAYLYDPPTGGIASKWTSDTAFMLVQYVCSATHDAPNGGSGKRNVGDPAEVVINPVSQFAKKVYFQTPTIPPGSGQKQFTNYVNVIVDSNASTVYDGVNLAKVIPPNVTQKQVFPVPNTTWRAYRLTYQPGSGEGTHIASSDSGAGIYIYGYGIDESYAWAGELGVKSPNDPDTIPPIANPYGPCFCAHVSLADTGVLRSHLSAFIADSSFNMSFNPDPNFISGTSDTSFYDMCIIDSSLPAYLGVSVYDIAGNFTSVISTYKPDTLKFTPNPLNFGTVNVGNSKSLYETICNTGTTPYHFRTTNLNLTSTGTQKDNIGFSIDSAVSGDIPPGGCINIKVSFTSVVPPTVSDTMKISDECQSQTLKILGNGGAADFYVTSYTFDCTPLNTSRNSIGYYVFDNSGIDIRIDSVWLDDYTYFNYDKTIPQNKLPFHVPHSNTTSGQYEIFVTFNPTKVGFFKTAIHFLDSTKKTERTDTLYGYGCAPIITSPGGTGLTTCNDPVGQKILIKNVGNYFDSIISVKGSNPKGFTVTVQDSLDNPVTLPIHLNPDQSIYADVVYTPTPGSSGCFVDSVIVTRFGNIEAVNPASFYTVCVKFFQATPGPTVDFGSIPYGSAKVTSSVELCNSGPDTLTITAIDSIAPYHSSSFQLKGTYHYKSTGASVSFGVLKQILLPPNDCLEIDVVFDPANSNVTNQTDTFAVTTNDCVKQVQDLTVKGKVTTGGPTILGFTDPPLFSCSTRIDSIRFTNPNAVTGKITAINNADPTHFVQIGSPLPITVPPGDTVWIRFQFVPDPVVGAKAYTSPVILTFDNGAGLTSTFNTTMNAAGQGWNLTVTSKFSNTADTASAGSLVSLPVQLSLNTNGVAAPLALLNIKQIRLTYLYNQNILHIDPTKIAGAVTFPNGSPWSLDAANPSSITAGGVLQVNLVSSAVLTDADIAKPLANITFKAVLPKAGDTTQVHLTNTAFIDNANNALSGCTAVATQDSIFTLIYRCGDSTIQGFMNGKLPMRAAPVSPNPVGGAIGNILSFKYFTALQGNVTLEIFDMLGNSVSKVIDNQNMPSGTFEARFNVSRLDEGTYIYRYSLNNASVVSGRFIIQK